MTTPDIINATFEGGMALFLTQNVRALVRDKAVHGVSILPIVFATCWGAYNIFFYRHIGLMASWYAGMAVVAVNLVWLGLAWKYLHRIKKGREYWVNSMKYPTFRVRS